MRKIKQIVFLPFSTATKLSTDKPIDPLNILFVANEMSSHEDGISFLGGVLPSVLTMAG